MNIDKHLVAWLRGERQWTSAGRTKENTQAEYTFLAKYIPPPEGTRFRTGSFGEELVRRLLVNRGYTVQKPVTVDGMKLDLETEDALWEVKTRSYTVTGTAGEKILAVPYKYCRIYSLTGKPVRIVLVGFQEYEGKHAFHLDKPICEEQKLLLDAYNACHVQFVFCSDLLDSVPENSNPCVNRS